MSFAISGDQRSRLIRCLAVLSVAALMVPVSGAASAQSDAGIGSSPNARVAAQVAPGDVFTKPRYLPFRGEALIGCVRTNCSNNGRPKHGYWALDFDAPKGTQVYAAGGGIVRVEEPSGRCKGGVVSIDHGGGENSRYIHIGGLRVSNGQVVDEDTPIGTFGGDSCDASALHFTVKTEGPFPTAKSEDPGPLRACIAGKQAVYPAAAGYSSWDSVPFHTRVVRNDQLSCWGAERQAGPPSAVQLKFKPKKLVVRWTPPAFNGDRATGYRIGYRHWSSSNRKWTKQRIVKLPNSPTKQRLRMRVSTTKWEVVVWSTDSVGASTGEVAKHRLKKRWRTQKKKWVS